MSWILLIYFHAIYHNITKWRHNQLFDEKQQNLIKIKCNFVELNMCAFVVQLNVPITIRDLYMYIKYIFVPSMRRYLTRWKTAEKYSVFMIFRQKLMFSTLYDVTAKNYWYVREVKVEDMSQATISAKICKVRTLPLNFSYFAEF